MMHYDPRRMPMRPKGDKASALLALAILAVIVAVAGCANPLCGYNQAYGCGYIASDKNMATMSADQLERKLR